MRVLIDGDAFPDIKEIIQVAKIYKKEVIIYIDTNHFLESDYAKIVYVSAGFNSVDTVLENNIKSNDLVLTQDYGVALIALSKNAICMNQYGIFYTNENIDYLLELKNISRKLRKHKVFNHIRKRTDKDRKKLLLEIENQIKN